jgi:hypothetical protein
MQNWARSRRRRRQRAAEERQTATGHAGGREDCGGQRFESPPLHQVVRANRANAVAICLLAYLTDKLATDHTTAKSRQDIKDAVRSLESIQVADLMEPLGRVKAPSPQR